MCSGALFTRGHVGQLCRALLCQYYQCRLSCRLFGRCPLLDMVPWVMLRCSDNITGVSDAGDPGRRAIHDHAAPCWAATSPPAPPARLPLPAHLHPHTRPALAVSGTPGIRKPPVVGIQYTVLNCNARVSGRHSLGPNCRGLAQVIKNSGLLPCHCTTPRYQCHV